MNDLSLFRSDPALPDVCPFCGSAVRNCHVDTGTALRAVPMAGGPYVLGSGDLLHFYSPDGYVIAQGHSDRRDRKLSKGEQLWGSHFWDCPKRAEWIEQA